MMPEPLVSIVMNCYNGEKYLRQAIYSIFKQTYQNWEIIFWDNQSNDKSSKIFKSYKDSGFLGLFGYNISRYDYLVTYDGLNYFTLK